MERTVDVAIVGGGVAGCAAAYYLAREGLDVAVLERDGVGAKSSGYAMGLLNPLSGAGIPGPLSAFAAFAFREHIRLWPLIEQETPTAFHARLLPHLELAMLEEDAPPLEAAIKRWNAAEGFQARWIDGDEVRRMEGRLAERVRGAAMLESLGMVESLSFTRALMDAAAARGARFISASASRFTRIGSRVDSIHSSEGVMRCGAVVIAAGAWSADIGRQLGLRVPVTPLKGQIARLRMDGAPLRQHLAYGRAVVQKADGLLWVGATEEEASYDETTTSAARESLLAGASRFFPDVARFPVVAQTSCMRPRTPDGLPIIGRTPGWDNVYLSTGAGKKGVLLAPAMGRGIASLITGGDTSAPTAGFEPERFMPERFLKEGSAR